MDEAKLAFEHNQYRSTLNRIYYANFYIVSALAAKHNFATSKHQQLMGWFNKEFVNPGKVNHKLWDIYSQSYKNRQESDYLDFVEYSKEEIEQSYSGML
ncbi:MAG: HEPN domain-containing protein [Bacteroidetes bacterium]|nr:MAG: HEPN domain-containing protein [Bacteroidota bacterium]